MSAQQRSPITTHILDLGKGRAAEGIPVDLEFQEAGSWRSVAKGVTNADGRIEDLLPKGSKAKTGRYRFTFETTKYFEAGGSKSFYPFVTIVFDLTDANAHHHVPLLLNAYGYSTYRGT
jgi:5-hydroxyisourate hydrolase